jgi:AraC-like DNA-binding protein
MSAGDWIFIFQSTELANVVTLDGHLVDWSELVILPPRHHFTFVVSVPVSWIAVSVHTPVAEKVLSSAGNLGNGRLTAKVPEFSMRQLVKLAHDSRSIGADGQRGKDAIETALLSKLTAMMETAAVQSRPHNSASSAEKIIRDALTYVVGKEANNIHVEDLTDAAQVEYRTLLRAFQRYLQITPKRYLKLRQLNLVRRALNAQETSSATDIMADFGVTEFGRFANDYKRLFHELPSETLRRGASKTARPMKPSANDSAQIQV